jgi:hypothetical protein
MMLACTSEHGAERARYPRLTVMAGQSGLDRFVHAKAACGSTVPHVPRSSPSWLLSRRRAAAPVRNRHRPPRALIGSTQLPPGA